MRKVKIEGWHLSRPYTDIRFEFQASCLDVSYRRHWYLAQMARSVSSQWRHLSSRSPPKKPIEPRQHQEPEDKTAGHKIVTLFHGTVRTVDDKESRVDVGF